MEIRITVLAGLLLSSLAIISATFTSGDVLLALIILSGVGIGTVWTNSDALVSTLVDENRLGAGMGAAQSFKEFGDMTGPLAVGLITQFYGVHTGFITCGVLALIFLFVLARSRTLAPSHRS